MTTTPAPDKARTRILLLAGVAPLVLATAVIVALIALVPRLPERIAVHWAVDGTADRYDSPWLLVGVAVTLALVGAVLMTALALAASRSGNRVQLGTLVVASFILSLGVPLGMLATAWLQVDATEVVGGGAVVGSVFGGIGVAIVLGVLAALLTPRTAARSGAGDRVVEALDLAPGERAFWSATAASPAGVILIPVVAVVGSIVLVVVVGAPWWSALLIGVALVLAATMLVWTVRVDATGVSATGLLGFPRISVPMRNVVEAAVVTVDPLAEFGGWGFRTGTDGRSGIVVRRGPAIEVVRRNRRPLVITVDDPENGARLLTALAHREQGL